MPLSSAFPSSSRRSVFCGRLTISVPPESTTLTPGHLVRWATEQRFADRARAALRAAALMKEPFAFDVAFAAANDDVTEDEIAEAWAGIPITDRDGLILRPLVSEAGLRRARFSHPIVREALQEELPIGDRPHTHRRIADQTERRMAESRDDLRITAWEAIGRHRALSGEHWLAAEAYRVAGRLAEESVAFSAAVRNYRNATNELSRALLAAETKRNEADLLLLLANTAYRLARLEPDDADPAECGEPDVDNIRDAEGYLSTLDDEFAALEAELRGQPVADPRDRSRVPQVDPTHHTRRLRHAISGYLSFLSYRDAEGLKGTPDEQRALLEILQHAEEAQAEGNATWLLAAASVQYARSLIVEADDLARGEGAALVRCERRLLEAFFHIERTLGLSPPTPDAVVNDPLCWARSVRSKLCEHLAPATKVAAYLVGCTSTVSTVRFEAVVWDLAQCRLTPDGLQHARNVQRRSLDLLHIYRHQLTDEDTIALERDLSIAAALHDWYSDIDASKLLTLAREWHLTINGAEWANPVLLHGRLAVEVARRQYGAAERLGAERFARIEAMVSNHTLGVANASFGERIFFIADSPCDLVGGAARSKDLDEHYRAAVKQKADTAFSDGRLMIVR